MNRIKNEKQKKRNRKRTTKETGSQKQNKNQNDYSKPIWQPRINRAAKNTIQKIKNRKKEHQRWNQ